MLLLLAALGCGAHDVEDTGDEPVIVDSGDGSSGGWDCADVSVGIDGDDPPTVGDSWYILLWCDDTLLTGSMVVRFDPPEVARLDENEATFIEPGDATLFVQVGRHNASRTVTIADDH